MRIVADLGIGSKAFVSVLPSLTNLMAPIKRAQRQHANEAEERDEQAEGKPRQRVAQFYAVLAAGNIHGQHPQIRLENRLLHRVDCH